MPIVKNNSLDNLKITFKYGCAMELVCSLHVITDPVHHTNCIDWYEDFITHVEKKLVKKIVDFGTHYANWDLVMDLIDDFTKPPSDNSAYHDDFFSVIERLDNLPREQFAYVFLGETLLGENDTISDLLLHPDHLDQYDLNDLYKYIAKEDVEYFITHVDAVKKEMIDIIALYYNCYFKTHWKKTCSFYRGALMQEKRTFASSMPGNFIASLHDNLYYENDTLIMKKEISFEVHYEKIKELKVILSAFTYPHLMINIYDHRISIYKNLIMPSMSTTFDDMAKSVKIFCDSTRLTIIRLLLDKELTNKSIASLLNITPASVSQHLKVLKDADMLFSEKRKNNIFYCINKDKVALFIEELSHFLKI